MRWKCVLFDLDGTLADTSEGVKHSIEYTIKKCGFNELSDEKMQSFIGPPIFDSLKKEYKLSDDEARNATEVFRSAYKDKYLFEARVYEGIIPLLSMLKSNSIKIAVATNKRIDYTEKLLIHLNLTQYFDCIQGSDFENKMRKPEIIRACINQLSIDESDTVLVGDTIHDYLGAKQCLIDFIGVDYGFGFKTQEERKLINNIPVFSNLSMLADYLII